MVTSTQENKSKANWIVEREYSFGSLHMSDKGYFMVKSNGKVSAMPEEIALLLTLPETAEAVRQFLASDACNGVREAITLRKEREKAAKPDAIRRGTAKYLAMGLSVEDAEALARKNYKSFM